MAATSSAMVPYSIGIVAINKKLDSDEIMTVGYLIRKGMNISPLGQKYLEEILKFKDKALI